MLKKQNKIKEIFKKNFQELLNSENERKQCELVLPIQGFKINIKIEEIEKTLRKLKNSKATKPSGII